MESKVIVIVGPTCSGKTNLSIRLAKKLNSEIISADSRQVYKFLDIGTAKPSVKELKAINHHLVDFLDPDVEYNASKFENDSIRIINHLHSKNIIPIVVGGSGLYIKALVDGIFDSVNTDEEYRSSLLEERSKFGNEYLYNKLKEIDLKTATTLLPQNWKRVIRALEVYHLTGEPIWKHQQEHTRDINFDFIQFGLNWERDVLYKNIELRVDEMINLGLESEVKNILNNYSESLNSLNTVGYKEMIEYLKGNITLDRAVELIKRNTRRYAKRQLTWFRKDERIQWFNIKYLDDLEAISENLLIQLK